MPRYNRCHVWHTAVTHFDVEFVADLVQSVMKREVFSEQSQEFLADVDFEMLAKRWVKPRDVLSSFFVFFEPRFVFSSFFSWKQGFFLEPKLSTFFFTSQIPPDEPSLAKQAVVDFKF